MMEIFKFIHLIEIFRFVEIFDAQTFSRLWKHMYEAFTFHLSFHCSILRKKGPNFYWAPWKMCVWEGIWHCASLFLKGTWIWKWVPCRNFLKHWENKESHVFTIDNTNALKKVHNYHGSTPKLQWCYYGNTMLLPWKNVEIWKNWWLGNSNCF